MFNDASSDFDVLVASDAIGMGLNLNISRIIFSTMKKFDGIEKRDLTISEIKQIAGSLIVANQTLEFCFGSDF
jgi:ATP-dependent RNA helicase SUPV3L1/SUV3